MGNIGDGYAFLGAMCAVNPFVASGFETKGFEVGDFVDGRVVESPSNNVGVERNDFWSGVGIKEVIVGVVNKGDLREGGLESLFLGRGEVAGIGVKIEVH